MIEFRKNRCYSFSQKKDKGTLNMDVLIVEDNPVQAEQIKRTLLDFFPDFNIFTSTRYDSAIKQIKKMTFNIFILDIDLGEGDEKSGMVIAKTIRNIYGAANTPILFLTSFPGEMRSAINDIHCYSYLLKPYSENELQRSISSLLATNLVPASTIEIEDTTGIYNRIKPEDIVYVEIFGHKLLIHTTTDMIESKKYTIEAFCKKNDQFLIKCHKSYAINPKYICKYSSSEIILKNGKTITIPISRSQKDTVLRRLSHE